jgi:hypothetical protein
LWNHCRFSAKSEMRPVFYRSESTFCRKLRFPVHCVFDEIHFDQCREQLSNSVKIVGSAAEDSKSCK